MEKLIAICGLNCSECEGYKVTQSNDVEGKKRLAEKWSKVFNKTILPENIECDGCRVDARLSGFCSICEVRKCGITKNVENCALCESYTGCKVLESFYKMIGKGAENIKNNLEKIRAGI